MTPIFSILCLIFFSTESIFFLKLASSAKKTHSPLMRSFAVSIFFLNLYFLFSATPQLLIKDIKLIELSLELALLSVYFAMAFFTQALYSFDFISKTYFRFLFRGIILLGLGIFFFNLLTLEPAHVYFYKNFIFWDPSYHPIVNIITGIAGAIYLMGAEVLFFRGAISSKDKDIKLRSFLFGLSFLFVLLGVAIRYIFSFYLTAFWTDLLSLIFVFAGIGPWMIAIFFIKPKPKFLEKITEPK